MPQWQQSVRRKQSQQIGARVGHRTFQARPSQCEQRIKDHSTQRDDIQHGKPPRSTEAPHVYPGSPRLPQIRCLCTSLLGKYGAKPEPPHAHLSRAFWEVAGRSFALRNERDNHANSEVSSEGGGEKGGIHTGRGSRRKTGGRSRVS